MGMSKDEYLITDAPLKALTVFAMPMILGSFFQQIYNMADSIIVGQFVGSSALAAVGACAALTNVFIRVALGAGVGAGVLVSRYFGAKEYGKMKTIVSTSLLSFLILSIVLGVFGLCFSRPMMRSLQTPPDILDEAVLYLRVYFAGFPFLFMYNILSTMFTSIGESRIPLALLIFSSVLNIFMDLWMVAGLGLGVFGAALATLIAQGISAVFSLLIFLSRMRRYQSPFQRFDGWELRSMLRIAVPSVLQQSTVSIGMMIVQAVVNPFGIQALAGYAATMRVENVFSLIFVSIGNAVSPFVSQNLGAGKPQRIKKGYHAALVLDVCFAILAFLVIETLHTQISSLFLGKDGTALAYQVSGDYMRWIGYFFIFMGIKMATDGVLRGLGIMRPFLVANMVNLAIRLSVALICAPRFGIAFVWLAVPAGWLANFLISYGALRRSWPTDKMASICTEANMKQTPQIRLVFTLTKRDGTDFERDAVTRGLGISPTMSCPPTPGKGKVQHCGKEIREPDEQVLPGFTVLPAEALPYPTLRHAYWSAELPKMDCRALDEPLQQLEQMLCGKEAEVRRLCEEYNLYADLTVRVFAASNDLPELVLPDGSVAFWASVGAAVSFDFYLD